MYLTKTCSLSLEGERNTYPVPMGNRGPIVYKVS